MSDEELTRYLGSMGKLAEDAYNISILPLEGNAVKKKRGIVRLAVSIWGNLLEKFDTVVTRLFIRDSWFEKRHHVLYNIPFVLKDIVNPYTSVTIQVGDRVFERRYRFRPIDVVEMMTMYKLAEDKGAREFFINEFIELVEDTNVVINGKPVTLKEYAKTKGLEWEKVKEHIANEVEKFFEAFKREMELYDNGGDINRNITIRGDRLAYYLNIRERLSRGNDIWGKLIPFISGEIGFTALITIIGRDLVNRTPFGMYTKKKDSTEKEIIASYLGIHPKEDMEKIIKHGNWEAVEYQREKMDEVIKRVAEKAYKRKNLMRKHTINIPILHEEVDKLVLKEEMKKKNSGVYQREKQSYILDNK